VLLEVFNNRFMHVAEQMGAVLQNTASSVNIKERLDYSCAVFDPAGGLVANAPHMPVHLGSMGESVRAIMARFAGAMAPGDSLRAERSLRGRHPLAGHHRRDAVLRRRRRPLLYVASRAHHADIGGRTPGSMPANSTHIDEEGVLDPRAAPGRQAGASRRRRSAHCSRAAAGRRGTRTRTSPTCGRSSRPTGAASRARADDGGIRPPAVDRVHGAHPATTRRTPCATRSPGSPMENSSWAMDGGETVCVAIRVDRPARRALIDFTGTSAQSPGNLNAPAAICRAAVLYAFRCLVDRDIPLNEGCLAPIELRIPEGSLLNPRWPAAVAGGNVETSQCVVDALFGALGVVAAPRAR
jgi:5-oxoprolinase (ATP-hydrolysing)